jgi:hypothetical protein
MFVSCKAGEALTEAQSGLAELRLHGVEPAGPKEAVAAIRELEKMRRQIDALQVDAQAAIERRGLHSADGHASAKVMVRHVADLSVSEATGREQSVRMRRDLADIAEASSAGRLGIAQSRLLALVHANVRVREAMIDSQDWFLEQAEALNFRDFQQVIRQWERLVDQDGPEPANERNHDNRNATIRQDPVDLGVQVRADYASMQGVSMIEIFEHYVAAERLADWEKARAEHGDDANVSHLPRTEQQRRADALWQLFHDAAAAETSAVPPEWVHTVVWDSQTYEAMVASLDGEDAHLDPRSVTCETLDGNPLDPYEAAAHSLLQKVRRAVVNATGTVIDQGQARCFTGSARQAVKLTSRCCIWPGCMVPTGQCQVDHVHEHSSGGLTNPGNGAPVCGRHNRLKTNGFRVWRDSAGGWHTYRPDGTEIT